MRYLVNFWNGMGKHAGQIQIIIALIALVLAVLGYYKVLDQITMSQDQMLSANQEREQVLKVNSINLLLDMMNKNMNVMQGNNRILKKLKEIDLANKSEEEVKTIKNYIALIEKKNKLVLGMKELNAKWARNINDNKPLDQEKQADDLKVIYNALIVLNEEITINDDILSSLAE